MQNLFDILGLPTAFALDAKALEKAYFAAQRACHPDGFVGKSAAERVAAISRSQVVNDAYDTLKTPITRAAHLLELQGIETLSDTAKASPALLMEVMDLRERLQDAMGDGAAIAGMVEKIKTEAAKTTRELEAAFTTEEFKKAAEATMRLHYLAKAMEEAHMLIYRLKAQA
ncbi:MAG: Fe-S protein assembly co-chaperone HscB [Rickettsiales bacterium]